MCIISLGRISWGVPTPYQGSEKPPPPPHVLPGPRGVEKSIIFPKKQTLPAPPKFSLIPKPGKDACSKKPRFYDKKPHFVMDLSSLSHGGLARWPPRPFWKSDDFPSRKFLRPKIPHEKNAKNPKKWQKIRSGGINFRGQNPDLVLLFQTKQQQASWRK